MPLAIDLGVLLAAFVALIVAFGALYVWRGTGKPFLLALAIVFNAVSVPTPFGRKHLFGTLAKWLQDAAESIDHSLAQLVLNSEKAVVLTWHGMAKQAELLGRLLGDLAETLEGKWRWWLALFPPAALVWAAIHAVREVPKLITRTRVVEHNVTKVITRTIHTATTQYVTKVVQAAAATAKAVAVPAPWVKSRVGELERDASAVRGELRRIAHTLTPAGIVALVGATFFSSFGLGWLRCRGVGRIGRGLCGLTPLIEAAFADALTAFAAIDLCWFVRGVETAAEEIRPLLLRFVDVENALIGRCGGDAISPLKLHGISYTPVVDGLSLKAL